MRRQGWNRQRRRAAAILLIASGIMFIPIVLGAMNGVPALVRYLDLDPLGLAPAPAWIAALLLAVGYIFGTFRALPEVREAQSEISLFKMVGVIAAIASGIMEEVVFRRWLMDQAMVAGVGPLGQIALSGLAFGIAHALWHGVSGDWRFSLRAVIYTGLVGTALAAIYLLGGRNLGPCIAAHFLINLVIEPWLMLAAVTRWTEAREREKANSASGA